jgi:hypothetical protein
MLPGLPLPKMTPKLLIFFLLLIPSQSMINLDPNEISQSEETAVLSSAAIPLNPLNSAPTDLTAISSTSHPHFHVYKYQFLFMDAFIKVTGTEDYPEASLYVISAYYRFQSFDFGRDTIIHVEGYKVDYFEEISDLGVQPLRLR